MELRCALASKSDLAVWKYSLIVLAVAGLTGCAGPKVWHKPGASRDDLTVAQRECRDRVQEEMRSDSYFRRERAAEQYTGADNRPVGSSSGARERLQEARTMNKRDELFLDCMRAKGFSHVSRQPF